MYLKNMSPTEIETHIKTLQEPDFSMFLNQLIEEFELTSDPIRRNSLALLLADYGKERALEPIIKTIRNPKVHNSRGTLLYALNELDYSEHLEYLFTLLFDNNFEVKREAFMLIEKAFESKNEDIDAIKKRIGLLTETIKQLQENIDFYVSVLELLSK